MDFLKTLIQTNQFQERRYFEKIGIKLNMNWLLDWDQQWY